MAYEIDLGALQASTVEKPCKLGIKIDGLHSSHIVAPVLLN
jgi:hypothetical protein